MDYSNSENATRLWKEQWDQVQDPDFVFLAGLQKEKEGEGVLSPGEILNRFVESYRKANIDSKLFDFVKNYAGNSYFIAKYATLQNGKKIPQVEIRTNRYKPGTFASENSKTIWIQNNIDGISDSDISKFNQKGIFTIKANNNKYTIIANSPDEDFKIHLIKIESNEEFFKYLFNSDINEYNNIINKQVAELEAEFKNKGCDADEKLENLSKDAISRLNLSTRKGLIECIVNEIYVEGYEENIISSLIENSPENQSDSIITFLEKSNNGNALIYDLCSKVSGTNYARLQKAFISCFYKSQRFKDEVTKNFTPDKLLERVFLWDNNYTLKFLGNPPPFSNKYDIDFKSNGNLSIDKSYSKTVYKNVTKFRGGIAPTQVSYIEKSNKWVKAYNTPNVLSPFSLVIFVNRSDLESITEAGINKGDLLQVPAIFLEFADDKVRNDHIKDIAVVSADIIGIAGGTAAFTSATSVVKWVAKAKRIVAALEIVNSTGNLLLNLSTIGEGNPKFKKFMEAYDLVMLATGAAELMNTGKKIDNYFSAKKLIKNMPELQLNSQFSRNSVISFFEELSKVSKDLNNITKAEKEGLMNLCQMLSDSHKFETGTDLMSIYGSKIRKIYFDDLDNFIEPYKNLNGLADNVINSEKRSKLLEKLKKLNEEDLLKSLNNTLENDKFAREFFKIAAEDIGVIDAWKIIKRTKYVSDPSFYKKITKLSKSSGESLSYISENRIPNIRIKKGSNTIFTDDLDKWLELLSYPGISKQASDKLDKFANDIITNPSIVKKNRPSVAGVIEGINYPSIVRSSVKNGGLEYFEDINPLIKEIMEEIKKVLGDGISRGHGKCAEVKILSDILNIKFGINNKPSLNHAIKYLEGSKAKAVDINKKGSKASSHGKFKCACSSCSQLFKKLNIQQVSH